MLLERVHIDKHFELVTFQNIKWVILYSFFIKPLFYQEYLFKIFIKIFAAVILRNCQLKRAVRPNEPNIKNLSDILNSFGNKINVGYALCKKRKLLENSI